MIRKTAVVWLATFGVMQTCGAGTARPIGDRPNILWLTCEDMSPNLGCYGDPDAVTPNLDRLASQGIRYTRAFAPAGVCATARSSLIMGMYASSIGTHHMRCMATLPRSIRPFTTYLRRAGYFCTNHSKQDYNFKTPPDAWDIGRGPKAHWRSRRPGQPFFAVFNYMDTHESRIRGPTGIKVPLTDSEKHDPAKVHLPPYLPDTPLIRKDWARYLDLITMMDKAWIPRLLHQLKEDGLADNTIIFFFSDHGVGLPRSKQFVYDSGMQVPLIIYFPPKWRHLAPGPPGSTVDRLVSFVDFGPTVLSLAGVPIPKHMQGKPFLGPQATAPRRYVFGIRDRMDERYDMTRTVRSDHFKYHRHYMPYLPHFPWLDYMEKLNTSKELRRLKREGKLTDGPAFFMADTKPIEELYDIRRDPYELHNLAGDPAYRHELERLRRVHRQWVLRTVDTGFIPEQLLRDYARGSSEYEYARSGRYNLRRIAETAWLMEKGVAARDELIHRLDDPDPVVRFWAANGLSYLGRAAQSADSALKQHLSDSCAEVRVAVAQALCRIGRVDLGLPALIKALDDDSPWVRLEAANAIDYLGPQARPAIPAMRRLFADKSRENMYIRWVFGHTLRVLGAAGESGITDSVSRSSSPR